MKSRSIIAGAGLALLAASVAQAGDPAAGKSRFASECSLCHSAEPSDGFGGMGPTLYGLIGKPAATSDAEFPYTPALKGSKLTWDAETLGRFLAGPDKVVPGTAMPITVADPAAREDLVAYFQSLKIAARPSNGDRR